MTSTLKFEVPGEPCAQGRPRFSMANGHAVAYDPAKSKNYKAFVKLIARDAIEQQDWKYTELPITVSVACYLDVPKSKSKKFREAALSGKEFPTKKPDADNLFKTITDALSGIAYKDDKQIIVANISKFYGETLCVKVRIELLGGAGA